MAKDKDPLEEALAKIEKQYGAGTVFSLEDDAVVQVDVIPSGSIALDRALGVGGWPRGRIGEIYGPESAGKTTLAMHVVAEAQKLGETCAYIDAEHAVDPVYAQAIGVKLNELKIVQPDSGEQALNVANALIRSGHIGVIIIDSVAALTPKKELEGEVGDAMVGAQPRMMAQALRIMSAAIDNTNTIVIFINQIREKIGVMYGSPETTPGGRALRFYASVRIEIRRVGPIKASAAEDAEIIGNKVKVEVKKNKVAAPFKKANFNIMFGEGVSRARETLDYAVDLGFVTKSGAWYAYGDKQIGQGENKAVAYLNENSDMLEEIYDRVIKEIKN